MPTIRRFSLPISSPRIALACAILWATTFVGSTYFPQVFKAEGGTVICCLCGNVSEVPRASEGLWDETEVRVFGRLVEKEQHAPEGFAIASIRKWRWRVTGSLALVGAILGTLIGGHRWWRWRTDSRTRPLVWLVTSALAFAALVLLGLPWSRNGGWFVRATDPFLPGYPRHSPPDPGELANEALALAFVAAIIGWAAHIVIVSWGLRPWGRPGADLVADYDDQTSPFPRAH